MPIVASPNARRYLVINIAHLHISQQTKLVQGLAFIVVIFVATY